MMKTTLKINLTLVHYLKNCVNYYLENLHRMKKAELKLFLTLVRQSKIIRVIYSIHTEQQNYGSNNVNVSVSLNFTSVQKELAIGAYI